MRPAGFLRPVRLCCVCLNGMLTWKFFAYFTFENHLYHLALIRVTFVNTFYVEKPPTGRIYETNRRLFV